jgi:hypothetical protein
MLPAPATWYILDAMYACFSCAAPVDNPREVFRSSTCAGCGKDLKVCRNCRFYSPGAHWDCAESIDEQVTDKERANFCTFFAFRDAAADPRKPHAPDARGDAKKKLDKLFGHES